MEYKVIPNFYLIKEFFLYSRINHGIIDFQTKLSFFYNALDGFDIFRFTGILHFI